MKAPMKIGFATAVLCIGGLYLCGGDTPQPPTTLPTPASDVLGVAAADASSHANEPELDRAPVSPYAFEESLLSHPYVLELTVHVVNEHGLPVSGFAPELAPPGGALRTADKRTDDHGTVVIHLPARQPTAAVEVLDPRRHRRRVTLRHGFPNHITLINSNGPKFTFQINGTDGIAIISSNASTQLLAGDATSTKLTAGLHPHAVFSERGLVPIVQPSEPTAVSTDVFLGQTITLADFGDLNIIIPSETQLAGLLGSVPAEAPAHCVIEGFVYGEDGKPKSEVPVYILGTSPQPLHRGKTDKTGAFRFEKLPPHTYDVRAGGTELGLATVSLRVDSGNYTQNLHLQREACIRGSVVNEHAKAIGKVTVEWLSNDGQWADRTKTHADGTFLLANLPSVPGSLYAWHEEKRVRFPIAYLTDIRPDNGEIVVTSASGNTGTLRVQPHAVASCKLDKLRLRVRHTDTGFSRGISMPRTLVKSTDRNGTEHQKMASTPTSPWQQASLPTGFYELEMWLPGCGAKNLGRHWVDGKADTDLGALAFAAPGLVHFDVPESKMPNDLKVEITALGEQFDVRIESLHTLANELRMAAGLYVLATQRAELPPQFQTFQVRSDSTTTLRVTW